MYKQAMKILDCSLFKPYSFAILDFREQRMQENKVAE